MTPKQTRELFADLRRLQSEQIAEAASARRTSEEKSALARWHWLVVGLRSLSVKPIFAWYDLWVGIFWDSRKRRLYVLPVPCVGIVIEVTKPQANQSIARPAAHEEKL